MTIFIKFCGCETLVFDGGKISRYYCLFHKIGNWFKKLGENRK